MLFVFLFVFIIDFVYLLFVKHRPISVHYRCRFYNSMRRPARLTKTADGKYFKNDKDHIHSHESDVPVIVANDPIFEAETEIAVVQPYSRAQWNHGHSHNLRPEGEAHPFFPIRPEWNGRGAVRDEQCAGLEARSDIDNHHVVEPPASVVAPVCSICVNNVVNAVYVITSLVDILVAFNAPDDCPIHALNAALHLIRSLECICNNRIPWLFITLK